MRLADVSTPALCVDMDALDRNVATMVTGTRASRSPTASAPVPAIVSGSGRRTSIPP